MNKYLEIAATICVAGLGALASAPASAQHMHGEGHVGVYVGVPFYAPSYWPAPYYAFPPVVIVPPAASPVYVERSDLQTPPQAGQASAQPLSATR